MESIQIFLIRHGESKGNQRKIFQGWTNTPLSEEGNKQAIALKEYFLQKNIKFLNIFSSPLARALETARVLQPTALNSDIIINHDFKSINVGDWGGVTIEKIQQEKAKEYWTWKNDSAKFRFPKGESLTDVLERAKKGLIDTLEQGWTPNSKIVMITHMITIKVLMVWFLNSDFNQIWTEEYFIPNTGFMAFEVSREKKKGKNFVYSFKRIPTDSAPHLKIM